MAYEEISIARCSYLESELVIFYVHLFVCLFIHLFTHFICQLQPSFLLFSQDHAHTFLFPPYSLLFSSEKLSPPTHGYQVDLAQVTV